MSPATCVRPDDASRSILCRIRSRWADVPVRIHTQPDEVRVTAANLTGPTGLRAVTAAVQAVMGDTWAVDHVTPAGTIVLRRGDASRD